MPPKTMDLLENFGRSDEDAHNQGDRRVESFSLSGRQQPSASHLLANRQHLPKIVSSHAESSLRSRSRSPPVVSRNLPTRLTNPNLFGYGVDQLQFIRLIPYKNPRRHFRLRRYTFPVDKQIELFERLNQYAPVPRQEQIVLSSFDDEVFAILEGADIISGIYTCNPGKVRAKINMRSADITPLSANEIRETPVGRNRLILNGYRVEHVMHNHGSLTPVEPPSSSRSSFSRRIALPTRLPSPDGDGYDLDQLQFIRLIPKKNRNLIFELRKYTFPADKLILFFAKKDRYGPVPIQELIVLTTIPGDVFAILESSNHFAGIYAYNKHIRGNERAKINMRTGTVSQLTNDEMQGVPVGRHRKISNSFNIHHINQNPLRHPMR